MKEASWREWVQAARPSADCLCKQCCVTRLCMTHIAHFIVPRLPMLTNVTGQKWEDQYLALCVQWQKSVSQKCVLLTQIKARAEITEGMVGGHQDQFNALSARKVSGPYFLLFAMDRSTTVPTLFWKSWRENHVALGLNYTALFGCAFPICSSMACRIVSLELLEAQRRCRSFKIMPRLFFILDLKEPVT